MSDSQVCHEVRALMPELATNVASGEVRAWALAHLAGCAECTRELAEVVGTVDALLLLAPPREPPAGFEAAVLGSLEPRPPRHRVRNRLLVAAALVLVAGIATGVTWWRGADDRVAADEYRDVLSLADGSHLRAADLTSETTGSGTVFAYEGQPSWMFMTVADTPAGTYHVRVVTDEGRSRWIGTCTVRDGTGSWGTTIADPAGSIDRIEMYGDGLPTLVADFSD
jgi:hypothetical protein